jgi:hypothetical protein
LGKAGLFGRGAIAPVVRHFRRRNADVAGERVRRLLADRRGLRLPAEAAERRLAALAVAHDVGLAGDAVTVAIVRIGTGENVGRRDLLDQAEADHRRRQAWRKRGVLIERPVGKIIDRIARLAQPNHGAVRQRDFLLLIDDTHPAFAAKTRNRQFLQLRAVDQIGEVEHLAGGERCFLLLGARPPRQPQEHRGGAAAGFRRTAASVLQMAILARPFVEQRTKPVRCLRRRGRRHPVLAEKGIAELEGAFFLESDTGGRLRESVLAGAFPRRAGATLHRLELLGLGKILGRPGDGNDARQILRRQIGTAGGETRRFERAGQRRGGQRDRYGKRKPANPVARRLLLGRQAAILGPPQAAQEI